MSPCLSDSKCGTGPHAGVEQQERKMMGPSASTWGSATLTSHFLLLLFSPLGLLPWKDNECHGGWDTIKCSVQADNMTASGKTWFLRAMASSSRVPGKVQRARLCGPTPDRD